MTLIDIILIGWLMNILMVAILSVFVVLSQMPHFMNIDYQLAVDRMTSTQLKIQEIKSKLPISKKYVSCDFIIFIPYAILLVVVRLIYNCTKMPVIVYIEQQMNEKLESLKSRL